MYVYYFEYKIESQGRITIPFLEANSSAVVYFRSDRPDSVFVRPAKADDPKALIRNVDGKSRVIIPKSEKWRRYDMVKIGYEDGVVELHFEKEPG